MPSSLHHNQIELLVQYRDCPSVSLRNEIVSANIRLVYSIAHKLKHVTTEPLSDLIQVGSIGLIKAVERFDMAQGLQFSTYATFYIHGEIQHHLRGNTSLIKIPRKFQDHLMKSRKIIQEYLQTHGQEPSGADIAEKLNITLQEWHEAKYAKYIKAVRSLDEPIKESNKNNFIVDAIADERHETFAENQENRGYLLQHIEKLEESLKFVLIRHFFQEFLMLEIAKELKVSRTAVGRRTRKAIAKLRLLMEQPS